jgi:hypothetical protein
MMATYKYSLEKYNGAKTRHKCPGCGKPSQFTRYKDNETDDYLADDVGMCSRKDKCGYHKPPKEYFAEKKGLSLAPKINQKEEKALPINYVPHELIEKSMSNNLFMQSNFALYLIKCFGYDLASTVLLLFMVGKSKEDGGTGVIYWQCDVEGKVRTGKIMFYDPATGKRKKEEGLTPRWIHKSKVLPQPFNYYQCFFGEHLISEHPTKPIAIVESEKTAIIATIYMPWMVWIATGGVSGVKWLEFNVHKVLQNRTVILFPDFGFYNRAKGTTCYDKWSEAATHMRQRMAVNISVSRVLEDNVDPSLREQGYDLADFLVQQDEVTGFATYKDSTLVKDKFSAEEWVKKFNGDQTL